jgi:hypothetical protein
MNADKHLTAENAKIAKNGARVCDPQHPRTRSIPAFCRELSPSEISNLKSEIPDFALFAFFAVKN